MLRLPNHLRRRREKVFGDGPRMPLDREAKVRIKHLARALKHKTEKGKHYGQLTGKFVDVLDALLWLIHDGRSGQCNPSYDTIADKAGCCPATVCSAIHALEICGILSWVNRITRIRERERDLFGHTVLVWKVVRTSNAYTFRDPKASIPRGESSKSKFQSGPLDKQKTQRNRSRLSSSPIPVDETAGITALRTKRCAVAGRSSASPNQRRCN